MLGITVNQGQRHRGLYALNCKIRNDRCIVMNPPWVGSLSIVDGQRMQAKCGDWMKLEGESMHVGIRSACIWAKGSWDWARIRGIGERYPPNSNLDWEGGGAGRGWVSKETTRKTQNPNDDDRPPPLTTPLKVCGWQGINEKSQIKRG